MSIFFVIHRKPMTIQLDGDYSWELLLDILNSTPEVINPFRSFKCTRSVNYRTFLKSVEAEALQTHPDT